MLTVLDDGGGFDLSAVRQRALAGGSIGVLGMQERAALVGGRLDIDTAPGRGSTVRMVCPWRLAEPAACNLREAREPLKLAEQLKNWPLD